MTDDAAIEEATTALAELGRLVIELQTSAHDTQRAWVDARASAAAKEVR